MAGLGVEMAGPARLGAVAMARLGRRRRRSRTGRAHDVQVPTQALGYEGAVRAAGGTASLEMDASIISHVAARGTQKMNIFLYVRESFSAVMAYQFKEFGKKMQILD